jgi:hypothetical protein
MVLSITYGYQMKEEGRDPLVDLADQVSSIGILFALSFLSGMLQALAEFSELTIPGRWIVDLIPMLRYLPSWLPGTGWQQIAKDYGITWTKLGEWPFALVKEQIVRLPIVCLPTF